MIIATVRGFLLNFGVYHATRSALMLPFEVRAAALCAHSCRRLRAHTAPAVTVEPRHLFHHVLRHDVCYRHRYNEGAATLLRSGLRVRTR